MVSRIRIVGVSDVSLGYGSPIIPAFMNSLAEYYGHTEAILIEPDQPEASPQHFRFPELTIQRVMTLFHPHNHPAGRIEYIQRAAKIVQELAPDILVVFCTYSVPVLFKLRTRPPFVIYYAVELTSPYGTLDIEMGRHISSLVDLIIYPEENRATIEANLCGIRKVPFVVLFNSVNPEIVEPSAFIPPEGRNGRILYSGTIDVLQTCFDYFLSEKMWSVPVDLFGKPSGIQKEVTRQQLNNVRGAVRYMGHVDSKTLAELRKFYSYSITIWRPLDENHFYAAPNKFFEALASGVPPITAPHPQCKTLVNRYKCGIVMYDWSFDAFYESIQKALRLYGTPQYAKMVENCLKAVRLECNWKQQFKKVVPYLPERL